MNTVMSSQMRQLRPSEILTAVNNQVATHLTVRLVWCSICGVLTIKLLLDLEIIVTARISCKLFCEGHKGL